MFTEQLDALSLCRANLCSFVFNPQPKHDPTTKPTPNPTKNLVDEQTGGSLTGVPTKLPTSHPVSAGGIITFETGMQGGASWAGMLVEAADYAQDPLAGHLTMVHLPVSDTEWYVGYTNGMVTLLKLMEGQWFLKGAMSAGQSETVKNWNDSGLDLAVEVLEINTDDDPSYASVRVRTFSGETI